MGDGERFRRWDLAHYAGCEDHADLRDLDLTRVSLVMWDEVTTMEALLEAIRPSDASADYDLGNHPQDV